MRSIHLMRRHAPGPRLFHLTVRTHDLGGTDYDNMVKLEEEDALAIAGRHTGISLRRDADAKSDVRPLPVVIERVPHRQPQQRAWCLRIGDHIASRVDTRTGERAIVHLSDEHVRDLERLTSIPFEKGQPDWELRRVEDLEDEASHLEDLAVKTRAKAQAARQALITAIEEVS